MSVSGLRAAFGGGPKDKPSETPAPKPNPPVQQSASATVDSSSSRVKVLSSNNPGVTTQASAPPPVTNANRQSSTATDTSDATSTITTDEVHFEIPKNQSQTKSNNMSTTAAATKPTSGTGSAVSPAEAGGSGSGLTRNTSKTSSSSSSKAAIGLGTADCAFNRVYENSKLRTRLEVIESIRADLQAENVEVPGVVVVGNQSAGKSSVLESISGINFPRGENTCTRCASIVRLESDPNISEPHALISTCADQSQGGPNVTRVTDFTKIGGYIESLTEKLGGGEKGTILLDDVIYITIRNRSGPTLTLIDLPGLTFVHKTQKNIHDVTVELIRRYIANEQAVILTVIPATEDFGNCEALNLASEVDPQGIRTLGVATKCDVVGPDSDIALTAYGF